LEHPERKRKRGNRNARRANGEGASKPVHQPTIRAKTLEEIVERGLRGLPPKDGMNEGVAL
jgi:hypothetical protein